jgi:hypothetical protein
MHRINKTVDATHIVQKYIHLGSIFEKTDGQNYTNDARLFQDILIFCIKQEQEGKKYFKHRKVANWLLDNNQEFRNLYIGSRAKTTRSNRITNTQDRVKNRLDDLAKLDLLRIGETVQEKGSGRTNLYEITTYAILLGLLIESILASDDSTVRSADQRLYQLFNKEFSKYRTSLSKFKLKLYSKLMSEDLFTIFVGDVLRAICLSDTPPPTMRELLRGKHVMISDTKIKEKADQYLKLWFESLMELDSETRSLFLYNIKSETENELMIRSLGPQTYEKTRFSNREDYNSVVVEGVCNSCSYVQPRTLGIEGYLKLTLIRVDQHYALSRCHHCKDKGIVVLTNL